MPRFLTVYSESVFAGAASIVDERIHVSSNEEFTDYVNSMDQYGLLFLDIVLRDNVMDNEVGWIEECLIIPDLTRFPNLEKIWIKFDGNIKASGAASCISLPNKVWMFAVRNSSIDVDLKFGTAVSGCFSYQPLAVVAFRNTRFSGVIHWETEQGIDQDDFGLLLWACGNTIVYNMKNLVFSHFDHVLNLRMHHHMLGTKGDIYEEGDPPEIIYHLLMDNLDRFVYRATNHYIDPTDELTYFLTNLD